MGRQRQPLQEQGFGLRDLLGREVVGENPVQVVQAEINLFHFLNSNKEIERHTPRSFRKHERVRCLEVRMPT